MALLRDAQALVPRLKAAVDAGDVAVATPVLAQLKIALTQLPSQQAGTAATPEEAALARDVLELAVVLSLKQDDMKALERNVAQARVYFDADGDARSREHRAHLLGVLLMHLLTEARLAEFHTEVEALRPEDASNAYIAFVLRLESYLAEGAYNKILTGAAASPSPFYAPFLRRLVTTVRQDIADCAAASYTSLSVTAAQKMLLFPTAEETLEFVRTTRPAWTITGTTITIQSADKPRPHVDAHGLMLNTMAYATEMERIV